MTHRPLATLVATVVVALAAACGGGEPAPVTPPNPPPTAAPVDTTPPVATTPPAASTTPPVASAAPAAPTQPGPGDWDKWSHEQKLAWMKAAVMPKMGQAFHDFDGAKYADPKCGLCHGAGAKDGSFKMPNPDLPKLPTSPAELKKLAAGKSAKTFEFMSKTVKPQMAALVGEPPMDAKGEGFGCFECHTKK